MSISRTVSRTGLSVILTLSLWSTADAKVVYVAKSGNDANDGLSWATAKLTVQAGLNTATAGDEVWVAAGTYVERVTLKAGAAVYAGFAGNETTLVQRDWTKNLAVLDGNAAGSVVTSPSGASSTTRIDGFTIRNASRFAGVRCVSSSPAIANNLIADNRCQGISCTSSSSPTIENNTITRNSAANAGGVYCSASSPTIMNNTITSNNGGGIYCTGASPTIANNTIADNTNGSGISCNASSAATITNNTITGHTAAGISCSSSAGTIANNTIASNSNTTGGGICCTSSSPIIENNSITDNSASMGGGVYCTSCSPAILNNMIAGNSAAGSGMHNGGGVCCVSISSPAIKGNTITGNTASNGAGIYCDSSSPRIENNSITRNAAVEDSASNGGGGICCDSSSSVITGNVIAENTVATDGLNSAACGGGVYCKGASPSILNNTIRGNSGADYGGGLYCRSSPSSVANNMIIGNSASSLGGGIWHMGGAQASLLNNTITANNAGGGGGVYCSALLTISNTIIAFNSSGVYSETATLSLRSNCVYGNGTKDYVGVTDPVGTNGNISADPMLVSRRYGNAHIQPDSPCLDAGDDALVQSTWTDIDGRARVVGPHVDIGADESDGTAWAEGPSAIVHVNPEGNDANDGSSWISAKRTIQAGIDAAAIQGGEVWVAAGTYAEMIMLRPYAHVFGGFGGIEDQRTDRNWRTHMTVLDGNQGSHVVTAERLPDGSSTIDGFTIRNSRTGSGVHCLLSSPLIANNTITGNCASGIHCDESSPTIANNIIAANGDGIACDYLASPLIVNNTIAGNGTTSGIGIYCYRSSPIITNTIIAYNQAGVLVEPGGGVPYLRSNCTFGNTDYDYSGLTSPTGTDGNISADPRFASHAYGNVHIQPDSPCVDAGDDSDVQADWTDVDGQPRIASAHVDIGADESDGAFWPIGPCAVVRVAPEGNDTNNGSSWDTPKRTVQAAIDTVAPLGGEVWVKAGIYLERIALRQYVYLYGGFSGTETDRRHRDWHKYPSILDGQFAGGVVRAFHPGAALSAIDGFTICNGKAPDSGGGVYCFFSSPTIRNNTITGNSATARGGAIYCYASSPLIANNTITRNTATYGGGVYCYYSSPTVANNTITHNSANMGGGGAHCSYSSLTLLNSVLAFNSSGLYHVEGTPTCRSNCVYGNKEYNYYALLDPTGTNGNLSADPTFVRSPSPGTDGKWATADDDPGDLHLKPGSPCIDAGDNGSVPAGSLTDLGGSPRFFNDPATPDTGQGTAPIVDIGAYEYVPGDFNRDGRIDIADLTSLTTCLSGPTVPYAGDCLGADFDRDTDVDQTDFGLLQRCFSGPTAPVDPACTN